MEERNALVFSQKSIWITTLVAAFQDEENLYLVMEYVSGGSLRNLMNNRESIMEETEAKFYMAEMILALEALHEFQYIHRDVKPENYLLDSQGHIKLADFGSCIGIAGTGAISTNETVGTPDYISPEILRALEGNSTYGQSVDWWSMGVILYELLFDEVPFYSESLVETYGKIMDHKKYLTFPEDIKISDTCKNLIQKLICNQDERLGRNGSRELKEHAWFSGIDWSGIRNSTAPFIPDLNGPEDTRYFEDEENESKKFVQKKLIKQKDYTGQNLAFVGYTYLKDATASITFTKGNVTCYPAAVDSQEVEMLKTVHMSLEKELSLLKSVASKESVFKIDLGLKFAQLEKDKFKIGVELSQLKLAYEHDSHEKEELQTKLTNLNASLQVSSHDQAGNMELIEIKKILENEIQQLSESLRRETENTLRRDQKLADSIKTVEHLNGRITILSDNNAEDAVKHDLATEKIMELQLKLKNFENAQFSFENREKELLAEQKCLEQQLKDAAGFSKTKMDEVEKARQLLNHSEKDLAMLRIEIDISRKKLLSFAEVHQNSVGPLDCSKEVGQVEIARQKALDELEEMKKKCTSLDMDIVNLHKELEIELEAHSVAKKSLLENQHAIDQLRGDQKILGEKMKQNEALIALQALKLNSKNQVISDFESKQFKTESSCKNLTNELTAVTQKLQEISVSHEMEIQWSQALKVKYAAIQDLHAAELKTRVGLEFDVKNFESHAARLNQESERQRIRIGSLVKEREDNMNTIHVYLSHITETEGKMDQKTVEINHIIEVNKNLKIELKDLSATHIKNLQSVEDTSIRVRGMETQVGSLVKLLAKERQRSLELDTRANEFEALYEGLKIKYEASLQEAKEDGRQLEKKSRSRLGRLFGIGSNSHISVEESNDHNRKPSQNSAISSDHKSFADKRKSFIFNALPDLLPFIPAEGLAGWLKVPKGGKVKKGWKLQYGVVNNLQLYIFENDRMAESPISVIKLTYFLL